LKLKEAESEAAHLRSQVRDSNVMETLLQKVEEEHRETKKLRAKISVSARVKALVIKERRAFIEKCNRDSKKIL